MNVTKGEQWEILADLVKRESSDLVTMVLEFMTEETYKYERGDALYPRLEYFISLAKNTLAEKKKLSAENIENIKQKMKLQRQTDQTDQTDQSDQSDQIVHSPDSIKRAVRESWLKKYETPAPATTSTTSTTSTTATTEVLVKKVPAKRRINVRKL